jgi:hypothetical protein
MLGIDLVAKETFWPYRISGRNAGTGKRSIPLAHRDTGKFDHFRILNANAKRRPGAAAAGTDGFALRMYTGSHGFIYPPWLFIVIEKMLAVIVTIHRRAPF